MPKFIKIRAFAKINLSLDVFKKTASGYHEIQTIIHEIPQIHDEIKILNTQKTDNTSIVFGPKFKWPKTAIHQDDNLAHKALLLLKKTSKIKKSAQIIIRKNIPIASGLGGASSDAAAVLKGLNKLWNLKISQKKLAKLAAKLGMDVPFFIYGGTALATHFGEKVKPLSPIKNLKFKIFPKSSISKFPSKTASAYDSLPLSLCGQNHSLTKLLVAAIKKNNKKNIFYLLHNDFETVFPQKPGHHLSGAGPSTFAII